MSDIIFDQTRRALLGNGTFAVFHIADITPSRNEGAMRVNVGASTVAIYFNTHAGMLSDPIDSLYGDFSDGYIHYIVGWYFSINSKSDMVIGQHRKIAADRDYTIL